MRWLTFMFVILAPASLFAADKERPKLGPATMVVESTLPTSAPNIRQFAFDGNQYSFYASSKNATAKDSFSLILDKPARIKSIKVSTGNLEGANQLTDAVVEISSNAKSYFRLASFNNKGVASGNPSGKVAVIRIRPTKNLDIPLVIREIEIDADPKIEAFRYPIEFLVDTSETPEMKAWCNKHVNQLERAFPIFADTLRSEGFTPISFVKLTFKKDYAGRSMIERNGNELECAAVFFKSDPESVNYLIRDIVHYLQDYKGTSDRWLMEGIASYIRIYHFEKGKPRMLPRVYARYNSGSDTTASFLKYVEEKHDPQIVRKVNAQMRAGTYTPEIWKQITGKTVEDLNEDWKKSLFK